MNSHLPGRPEITKQKGLLKKSPNTEAIADCMLVLCPEAATLADTGVLPCKVVLSCFMGAYQNYHVMVGDTLVKITDFNPKNKKTYQVGECAFVAFDKENVHIL